MVTHTYYGKEIRRSKALALVIDAWLRYGRTANNAADYLATAEQHTREGKIARYIVESDVPGLLVMLNNDQSRAGC